MFSASVFSEVKTLNITLDYSGNTYPIDYNPLGYIYKLNYSFSPIEKHDNIMTTYITDISCELTKICIGRASVNVMDGSDMFMYITVIGLDQYGSIIGVDSHEVSIRNSK